MKYLHLTIALVSIAFHLACDTADETSKAEEPDAMDQVDTPDNSNDDAGDYTDNDGETIVDAVTEHGQLRIADGKIVNQDGNSVQLRGMSFFWSQWMGQYYTPETVQWLKEDWRCNVVRAAMGVEDTDGYLSNPEIEKQKVFTVIDAAIDNGIYVLVDWHSHHAEDHVNEAVAFFSEVAQKYGNYPNIIYETYNEPLDVNWNSVLKPYHEQVLAAIRQYDPDNIVVCGTRTWSQRVDEVVGNPINDPNVAYTLHYYAATHKQELRNIAQLALDNNIPIFVTEYGVSEANGDGSIDVAESETWWQFLDSNNISWCNWSIADKEELSAALQPNASAQGGWSANTLTQSGTMVRAEIRSKNTAY
ncbi:MAG: glycoside hydrolase family 5 protein [Bacteroidota bacterium]